MPDIELIRRRLIRATRRQKENANSIPVKASAQVPQGLVQRAMTNPHLLQSSDILYLQRTIGNSALSQLLRKGGSGMTVGASNSRFEQEADRISEQVSGPEHSKTEPETGSEGGTVSSNLESRIQSARGGGSPAPESIRRVMEEQTGSDFSDVRVHDDKEANSISSQLGAKAATYGKDIFLARNQSPHDVQLMAHELTHTAQQGAVKNGNSGAWSSKLQGAPHIQRDDDEKLIKKLKKKLRGAKAKRGLARAGQGVLTGLDWLTTAPLRVLDQMSVLDLHVKDFVNFAKTGKTRKQRLGNQGKTINLDSKSDYTRGNAKRKSGRTGLRALLSGVNKHAKINPYLPWHGTLNPFLAMGKGQLQTDKLAKGYSKDISNLRGQKKGIRDRMVEEMVDNDQTDPMDDEVSNEIISTLMEDEEHDN